MSLAITIGYRLYSDTANVTISSFTFFSIKNRGMGSITMQINSTDTSPNNFIIGSGESFAFPYVTAQYEQVYIRAAGNDYSILTDGQIS